MDAWEIGLFGVAAFVAVTSLVRLMKKRHDSLVTEMRSQIEAEQRKKKAKRK